MKESMQKKIEKAIAKQQDVKEVLDDPRFGVAICNDRIICYHEVEEEHRNHPGRSMSERTPGLYKNELGNGRCFL